MHKGTGRLKPQQNSGGLKGWLPDSATLCCSADGVFRTLGLTSEDVQTKDVYSARGGDGPGLGAAQRGGGGGGTALPRALLRLSGRCGVVPERNIVGLRGGNVQCLARKPQQRPQGGSEGHLYFASVHCCVS